jgi:hypothetical protein
MSTKNINRAIEKQARFLAYSTRLGNPDVVRIYWFPDNDEVRLISLTDRTPQDHDDKVCPFYFRASPEYHLHYVSAVAMIRVDDFGKLRLPDGWGNWDNAVELVESILGGGGK